MTAEIVRGFQDYSEEQALKRAEIKKIIQEQFELYGFMPCETPIIEYEDFVKQGNENSEDEAVSDIFKLQDKGKRKLALRYEFTFQLKRLAENKKLPFKRYQIGEVFRDEPTSKNRFRQFTQCDADIVGNSVKDEAEILALTSSILNRLGIKFTININNRKFLNEILQEQKIKEKDKQAIIREIDKLDKLPEKEVRKNLKKYKAEKILNIFKKSESFFKKFESYKEIQELKKYCRLYNVQVKFQPSLARGLSYYNGNVFEIKTENKNIKETIAAGGSYSVEGIPATGISFGLERLSELAKIKLENKSVLIISIAQDKKSIKLAENLRKQNLRTELWTEKGISKALDYANSKKIPFVIFLGKEEIKKGKIKLRNMKTGKEKLVSEKQLKSLLS